MAHLIIDGYNLIRQSNDDHFLKVNSLEDERGVLISKLSAYRKSKGHQITVIFDATFTDNQMLEAFRVEGIHVVFSRSGETADDVMIDWAKKDRDRLVVVSSDKAILHEAKKAGCAIITSSAFEKKVENSFLQTAENPFKKEPPSNKPVHKRYATKKKGPSKRLPKAKRRAHQRLKDI